MKLYGIGVGPGDPELLTVKAVKLLKKADMIVAPKASREKKSIAFSIIEKLIEKRKKRPIVLQPIFPMTKDSEILRTHWKAAVDEVLEKGKECKIVAFVTLGDPSLYSTFFRFLDAIPASSLGSIQVEIIPGITAFSACSAVAKVPIAEGDDLVAIIPEAKKLDDVSKRFDSFVIMKPSGLHHLKASFRKERFRTAVLGIRIGLAEQRLIYGQLEDMPDPDEYLSILLVRRMREWK